MAPGKLIKSFAVHLRGYDATSDQKIPVPETPGNALREAFDTGGSENQAAAVPIPSDRLQTIETHVDNLNQMIRALQAQRQAGSGHPGVQRSTSTSQSPALSGISTSPPGGQSYGTRYVDLAFLTSLCDEVAELGEVLSNQARYLLESEQTSPTEAESEPDYQAQEGDRRLSGTPGHFSAPSSLQTSSGPRLTPLTPLAPPASTMPWDAGSDVVMDQTGIDWAYFDQVLHENGYQEPDSSRR